MIHLYKTSTGALGTASELAVARRGAELFRLEGEKWDELLRRDDLPAYLEARLEGAPSRSAASLEELELLPPIGSQEVWAAGVTYYRSRDARMEESKDAGGGDFYDRVYDAERPELFMKSTPHRVVGPGGAVRIRKDATWNVPEPELTLLVSAGGTITGYTIGNDMSSRDIEGENPLYLPQAKVYDASAALGPCIVVTAERLPRSWRIDIVIRRNEAPIFRDTTTLDQLKREPEELVEFLYRDNSFPAGCFLMTGTGIVPPTTFTLAPGDEIEISVDAIGSLVNTVVQG